MQRLIRILFARPRTFAAMLLLHQFFFFNLFLPSHTVGAMTLDGKHTGSAPSCCCCDNADDKPAKPGEAPSQRDKNNCVVCHFAARTMPAYAVKIEAPKLAFLLRLAPPTPIFGVRLNISPTYLGTGPPTI